MLPTAPLPSGGGGVGRGNTACTSGECVVNLQDSKLRKVKVGCGFLGLLNKPNLACRIVGNVNAWEGVVGED